MIVNAACIDQHRAIQGLIAHDVESAAKGDQLDGVRDQGRRGVPQQDDIVKTRPSTHRLVELCKIVKAQAVIFQDLRRG